MSTATCTHCDAETTHDSDLCEVHHAEREALRRAATIPAPSENEREVPRC